jgi:hypothetical protein
VGFLGAAAVASAIKAGTATTTTLPMGDILIQVSTLRNTAMEGGEGMVQVVRIHRVWAQAPFPRRRLITDRCRLKRGTSISIHRMGAVVAGREGLTGLLSGVLVILHNRIISITPRRHMEAACRRPHCTAAKELGVVHLAQPRLHLIGVEDEATRTAMELRLATRKDTPLRRLIRRHPLQFLHHRTTIRPTIVISKRRQRHRWRLPTSKRTIHSLAHR